MGELQYLLLCPVAHLLLHVNSHVQFLNLVVIQHLIAATLEIAHLVLSLLQRSVLVDMLFLGTFLVVQRILDVTNFVVRLGSVVCMHVAELVTHHLVILLRLELKQVQELLVGRHVVPLEEIADTLALHFVILPLLVLM